MDYIYDASDSKSIEAYAKKMIGKTFQCILEENSPPGELDKLMDYYGRLSRKGGLGNMLEEVYFKYKANSNQSADFEDAGVELKVTPYETKKDGSLRAGERLVLTMISYEEPFEEDFYASHVWEKSKLILLIYYHRNREFNDNLLYKINYATLFTPPKTDLIIIQQDYELIKSKIVSGRAHELSEGDTLYLGACTKGSTSEKSTVPQYYNPDILAKKRAFCFKTTYMTYVLTHYIAGKDIEDESIVKDDSLSSITFEQYICNLIIKHKGQSDYELCHIYDREYNNNKAQWVDLAYRMLGIKSNKAEEFKKANIVVKSIRLEENGVLKESMSFPTFRFKEISKSDYHDSDLYNYFNETKLFFVIWKKKQDYYYLEDAQLWNMPESDLEGSTRKEWELTKAIINNGIQFENRNGIIYNNLPGAGDTEIIHVRPHSSVRAYKLKDGTMIGDIHKHADELPDGQYMTTQCFWLNKSYILKQLKCLKK